MDGKKAREEVDEKVESGGGMNSEGSRSGFKRYISDVKSGFIPAEGTAGLGGFLSRIRNLWDSGNTGKGTLVCLGIVFPIVLGGGGMILTGVLLSLIFFPEIKEYFKGKYYQNEPGEQVGVINCKECNHEISSNAKACPSCGSKTKKYRGLFISVAAGILILIGIAALTSNENAQLSTYQRSTYQVRGDGIRGVAVKGLYLGMSIDDVPSIFADLFSETDDPRLYIKGNALKEDSSGKWFIMSGKAMEYYGDPNVGISVWANEDKEVGQIEVHSLAANVLFNVWDLEAEEFAQLFIDNYEVAEMEPVSNGWKYIDQEEGYSVFIGTSKMITMKNEKKMSERKFD
ncbi:zinc ribbon domain-containing protein [Pontiellaceae bacterium B12227]|nr:zinc ribbon domain-containing protein [Pontiellaceae bacterium B12227]